jgi:hypothetical protein
MVWSAQHCAAIRHNNKKMRVDASFGARSQEDLRQNPQEAMIQQAKHHAIEERPRNTDVEVTVLDAFRRNEHYRARPMTLEVFFRQQQEPLEQHRDNDNDSSVVCFAGSTMTDEASSAAISSPKRMRYPQQADLDDTHFKKQCLQD